MTHPYLPAIIDWARREHAIRAVVITGSLARHEGATDQFSDLDAQIITTDIARHTADDSWLDRLGEVWIRFPLDKSPPYRLVWFAGGIKVDFQFVPVDSVHAQIDSGALSDEYLRGYHVALDKDGLFDKLPPSPRIFPQPPAPTQEQALACMNEFWFESIHVAQFIRRREFWVVKHRDWTMKTMLLRMLEWHARATSETPVNAWLLGKRMADWTREDDYAAVTRIWAGWDVDALWGALMTQLDLFARLSRELCAALGYDDPLPTQADIVSYIRALREDRPPSVPPSCRVDEPRPYPDSS